MAINALIAQGVRPIGADLPQIAGMLQDKRQADTRNALMQQQAAQQQQQSDNQNTLFNQGQEQKKLHESLAKAQWAAQPGVSKEQIARDIPEAVAFFEQQNGPGSWANASEAQVSASAQDAVHTLSAHLGQGPAVPKYKYENVNGHLVQTNELGGPATEVGNYQKPEEETFGAPTSMKYQGKDAVVQIGSKGTIRPVAGASPYQAENKPQLVDVPMPDGTVQKQWLYPGQKSGAAVGSPKPDGSTPKPTEADKKAAVLLSSMTNAEKTIFDLTHNKDGTENKGATDTSSLLQTGLGAIPGVRMMQSDAFRQYESAGLRWAANLLYLKSGATATPDEIRSTWKQFFPQPNEGQDVKDQKAAARQQEISAVQANMGPQAGRSQPSAPPNGASGGWTVTPVNKAK